MKNVQRNVVFSVVGYALPLLAALATIPFMVSKLGTEFYGLYVICVSLIGFMTLVDLGVGQSIIKYVAAYEATGQQAKVAPVLNVSLLVYVALGAVSVVLLYALAPMLAAHLYGDPYKQMLAQKVLRITTLPLFFSYLNQFYLNVCKAYHRFDVPAVIHNLGNLGGIAVATALLLADFSLVGVMWGYVAVQALALASGYIASHKVLPAGIHPYPVFDRVIFDEIVSFSFYTFMGNFFSSLTTRADKLLIGLVIGTEAVTYYQIPFTIAQMANGIIHTLAQIAFPRFSEMSSLNDKEGLLALYRKVSEAMFLISMVLAVMMITVGGDFLGLWISPEFAAKAGPTLQIIAAYFFLHSNTVAGYWVLQGSGQAKLTALIGMVGMTAYFIGIYYLGGKYSYNGVAFALFLLLSAVPLQYMWINRYIGHSCINYLAQVLMFGLLGYGLVCGLELFNQQLNNSLLEIIADAVLMLLMLAFGLWIILGGGKAGSGKTGLPA
ncbi:oligosaccharide flippase family protein [Candidatus Thiothrix sp. Deng01]|uniref:Oligosaccharide flippase family protein n=1 Tax=Candidatus Thiothrix phosphatis TaxID=3112415 RepID=A0ABU6CX93_9GAMM|nr:oligosaccharide flippase family protein [Candidatus Thiothrix sp. Deng01]MEB4591167.1 oligosaccharide flippase family protein [Candidatus Thiothrix sp. Deng01]